MFHYPMEAIECMTSSSSHTDILFSLRKSSQKNTKQFIGEKKHHFVKPADRIY